MALNNVLAAGALASCVLVSSGIAEVALVDTGTPDGSSRTAIWYNAAGNFGQTIALRFDLAEATPISRIELFWGGDADDAAGVMLVDRLGAGSTPANLLETWTMQGTGLSGNQGQWESMSVGRVLGEGVYHIIVTPLNNDLNGGWLPTRPPNSSGWGWVANSVRPTGNDFLPSYDFNPPFEGVGMGYRVFAVPSPGAAGALALGGLLAARRRRA